MADEEAPRGQVQMPAFGFGTHLPRVTGVFRRAAELNSAGTKVWSSHVHHVQEAKAKENAHSPNRTKDLLMSLRVRRCTTKPNGQVGVRR